MNASQTIIIRQGLYEDMDKAQIWMSRKLFAEVFKSGESKMNRPRVKLRFGEGNPCFAEALEFDTVVKDKLSKRGDKCCGLNLTDTDLLLTKWQRRHLGIWEIKGNPGGVDWEEKMAGTAWKRLNSTSMRVRICAVKFTPVGGS